jgi:ACR3 family arsenite efflux pump ArsB
LRTFVFLVIPFTLLALWRPAALRMSERTSNRTAFAARWATIIALLVFGTGLMSVVSDKLASDPSRVLLMLALATIVCLLMMALTTIVMYRFGHAEALTASIVAGFRNIGLGYALVGETVGPDLAAYAGVSLLPIFVAPLVLRLIMVTTHHQVHRGGDVHQAF